MIYSQNFDAFAAGALPTGWANVAPVVNGVVTSAMAVRATNAASAPNSFGAGGAALSVALYTAQGTFAILDATYKHKVQQLGGNAGMGFVLRSDLAGNNLILLMPVIFDTAVAMRHYDRTAGTDVQKSEVGTFFPIAVGTVLNFRVNAVGALVRWKVWAEGTAEPASWTDSTDATTITAAGYPGFCDVTGNRTADDLTLTADYLGSFDSDVAGTTPAGWNMTGIANFVVRAAFPVSGANSFGQLNGQALAVALKTDIAPDADPDITISQKIQNLNAGGMGIVVRSTLMGEAHYALLPVFSAVSAAMNLFVRQNGAYTSLDTSSHVAALSVGDVVKMRFAPQGSTLRWKFWRAVDAEPGTWETFEDETITTAGYVGLSDSTGSSTADDISILDYTPQTYVPQTYIRENVTLSTGQAAMILRPRSYVLSTGAKAFVQYHHGAGETETALLSDPQKAGIVKTLIAANYILCGTNAHGNNAGNEVGIEDYRVLDTYCRATYNAPKTLILAQSLGGLSAWNVMGSETTFEVHGAAFIYPVCSLAMAYVTPDLKAIVAAAYGIAGDGSDYLTLTDGYDPITGDASRFFTFGSIGIRFYASYADTLVPRALHTDVMQGRVDALAAESDIVTCTGNHGDNSHFQPEDLLAFYERRLSGQSEEEQEGDDPAITPYVRDAAYLTLRVRELVAMVDPGTALTLVDGFDEDDDESTGTSILAALNRAYRELIGTGLSVRDFNQTLTVGTRAYAIDPTAEEIVTAELIDPDTPTQSWPLLVGHVSSDDHYWWTARRRHSTVQRRPNEMLFVGVLNYELDYPPDKAYTLHLQAYAPPADLAERNDLPAALPASYHDKLAVGAAVLISRMQVANAAARIRLAEYKVEWEQAKRDLKALVFSRQINAPSRPVPIGRGGSFSRYRRYR